MTRRVGIPGRADGRVLSSGGVSRSGATTDGHLAVWNGSSADSIKDGGSSVAPSHAYYSLLCATMEPLAYEVPLRGTISYTVGASVTKILRMGWGLSIGSAGRLDLRDLTRPLYLRNTTLTNNETNAIAAIIDPALATYTDAWTTYHDRLNSLATLNTKWVAYASAPTIFLPGPYGNIITYAVQFGTPWIALYTWRHSGSESWPLMNEIDDTNSTRIGMGLTLPVSKSLVCGLETITGTPSGGVAHIICPSTWGKVTDPLTYSFRDDFMGASLDTTTNWTRAQGVAGNVEIDTTWQWCKLKGDGASWGPNGAHTQSSFARSSQPYMLIDCFMAPSGNSFGFEVGWSDGVGHTQNGFAHGLLFQNNGTFVVTENGNNRGGVGAGFTLGAIYRVRIRALSGGGATYEIQGGSEYNPIGSASWTNITPGTTSSATNTLYAAFSAAGEGNNYVSDVRVYT